MLIIKRAEKAETIIDLLQSYYANISKTLGLVDEKQGVMMSHSLMDAALFNVVCGYKEPANVLNVAAILENVKAQKQPFMWVTHDSNIHLQQYLVGQGLEKRGLVHGVYYSLNSKAPTYDSHPAVQLIEVVTEEQFYEWCHVFSQCHGVDAEQVEAYFKSGFGEDRCYALYLAQVYQKSVACCAMYMEDSQALLLWDSVLPMYRRQGVGSMMVLRRMEKAKEAGCDHMYAFGIHASLKMYRTIGFKSFGKFQLLRFDERNHIESEGVDG